MFSLLACKYVVNPIALSPFQDGLALCVFEGRADTPLKKCLENFTLCCPRPLRTAAAAARVLHHQVKWRGSGFVLHRRVAAGSEKKFHRVSAACSDGAVQRSRAVPVL